MPFVIRHEQTLNLKPIPLTHKIKELTAGRSAGCSLPHDVTRNQLPARSLFEASVEQSKVSKGHQVGSSHRSPWLPETAGAVLDIGRISGRLNIPQGQRPRFTMRCGCRDTQGPLPNMD